MKKLDLLPSITLLALLLQGCAYAISSDLADKADRTISFEQLLADPDLFQGRLLILGGVIGQVTPVPDGTLFGVIQKPLDYWGRPIRTTRSGGRFLLFHAGGLDPLVYAPGRELTVAAEVAGTKFGGMEYVDPVLVIREARLWEKQPPAAGRPPWGDPLLYDPYGRTE